VIERPFLPYARQSVDEDDVAAVVEVLRGEYLTTGPAVTSFENALAQAVDAEWSVAVSSGTAALHAACAALGLGPGDEVVVPAVTFLSTANCALYVGAEPVFADVHPDTGLIDVESAAARATQRTRAFIPVHLGGASADVPALAAIAARSGAAIIEDAAHALGASRNGGRIGGCRDGAQLSIFSFHPVKHITTGEGGAVTGRDPELLHGLRRFREHGVERSGERLSTTSPGPWYYEMQELGHNFRMTDIQAALGRSQLLRLTRILERRQVLARAYERRLHSVPGVVPVVSAGGREGCAWHLYQVLIDFDARGTTRADVMRHLQAAGIGTQVHYIPLPLQPYYRRRGWSLEAFPGARRFYERTLSLPLFPAMDDRDVERVVDALAEALQHSGGRP
jgi:UDP-4-amino-4,6-dideoxy-N-acetyl-beta-L-altrosamine transaminase